MATTTTLLRTATAVVLLAAAAVAGACRRCPVDPPARHVHPRARVYRLSNELAAGFRRAVFGMRWKDTDTTVGGFVAWCKARGMALYFYGGAVRDFLQGQPVKDVDLFAGNPAAASVPSLLAFCDGAPALTCRQHPRWPQVVKIQGPREPRGAGEVPGVFGSMDVSTAQLLEHDPTAYDFTVNWVALSTEDGSLVDLTGTGLDDIRRRIVRIAAPRPQWTEWYQGTSAHCHRLVRYIKFLCKGYRPADADTDAFIARCIARDWDRVRAFLYVFEDTERPDVHFDCLLAKIRAHAPESLERIARDVERARRRA